MQRIFQIIVFISCLISSATSLSAPRAYENIAQEFGLAGDVLYAIALVESSGSSFAPNQPWPWTLNINGKGYYYPSRKIATDALVLALAKKQAVDIGLTQVSWRHHSKRFVSFIDALDPITNLRAGAAILAQELEEADGNLSIAIGHYHTGSSNTPERKARANRYTVNVITRLIALQTHGGQS